MLLVVHRLRNTVIPPWFKDSRSRDMLVNHPHSFSKRSCAISKLKLKPEIAGNLRSGILATGNECRCNFPFLQQMPNLIPSFSRRSHVDWLIVV